MRKSARTTVKSTAITYLHQLIEKEGHIARTGLRPYRVSEMLDRFNAEHVPNLKSAVSYRLSIKNVLKPRLGEVWLDALSRQHLVDLISARRAEGVSSATIRRDVGCLSSALTLAIAWGWVEHNVVRLTDRRMFGPTQFRRRYLSHEEERRLLQAASPRVRDLIVFAIATGLRRGEQLRLQWDQVDLVRRELRLMTTKSGVPRIVPLSDRAIEVLVKLKPHPTTPYVFVSPETGTRLVDPSGGLEAAARRAGITDLRWHDLRRTCGCRLIQDYDADLYHVSRWLGHSSTQITEKAYAFLRVQDLHGVIRRPMTRTSTVELPWPPPRRPNE